MTPNTFCFYVLAREGNVVTPNRPETNLIDKFVHLLRASFRDDAVMVGHYLPTSMIFRRGYFGI